MLAGGQRRGDVESISIATNVPSTCGSANMADVPVDTKGGIGLTDGSGRPMVCGGGHNPDKQTCYVYNSGSNTWSDGPRLTAPRDGAQAVLMPDGNTLIFGGAR